MVRLLRSSAVNFIFCRVRALNLQCNFTVWSSCQSASYKTLFRLSKVLYMQSWTQCGIWSVVNEVSLAQVWCYRPFLCRRISITGAFLYVEVYPICIGLFHWENCSHNPGEITSVGLAFVLLCVTFSVRYYKKDANSRSLPWQTRNIFLTCSCNMSILCHIHNALGYVSYISTLCMHNIICMNLWFF